MRAKYIAALSAVTLGLVVAINVEAGVVRPQDDGGGDFVPNGKGWGEPSTLRKDTTDTIGTKKDARSGRTTTTGGNGINYHGGPVMLGTTNVYYIWYGNWTGNSAVPILNNLALSLGGSPYFNINTTYYDGNNRHISNAVAAPTSATDSYSQGTALSDSGVLKVVANSIASGALPKDPNGVYMVLTSADVNETSGFCTQYCGWHSHASILGVDTKFAFVGNPARCPSACSAQSVGPNGNVGADAMASIIAHETDESVNDPDLNAWYDSSGEESADKCAWKFGTLYKVANGAYANMNLGGRNYLIQQNWVNAGGGLCALSY